MNNNPNPIYYTTLQPSAVASETHYQGDPIDTEIFGNRITSKGEVKQDYVAMRALRLLYSEGPLPIYTFKDDTFKDESAGINYDFQFGVENLLPSKLVKDFIIDGDDFSYLSENIQGNNNIKLSFNEDIENAVKNGEKPLIMLIVTPYHAILYIIHSARLYTVGFGYYDENEKYKILTKINQEFAHTVELLNGALYSADMVAPSSEHAAKIAWIDYLNMDMIERIKEDLTHAKNIIFDGEIKGDKRKRYVVSEYTTISLDNDYHKAGYRKAARFIPIGKNLNAKAQNCIIWARNILGVKLNCGIIDDPYLCKEITPDEFKEFVKAYSSSDDELDRVIEKIKKRLTPGVCDSVSSCAMSGGKTRKRKNRQSKKSKTKGRKIINKRRKYRV
jgi:hypothetical protein